jgi:PAS domain S-box-containing protein
MPNQLSITQKVEGDTMPRPDDSSGKNARAAGRIPTSWRLGIGDAAGDVLVVDDCATSLTLVMQILRHGGYVARTARDARAAQQAILSHAPSLLLVDLDVSKLDGLDLCEWIKRQPSAADHPVVFVSSTADPAHKAEAFRRGGADFIAKPVEAEELLLRVGLHLQLSVQQQALRQSFQEREAEVEAQLRRSNGELLKLHAAVEQSPSSVIMMDREGRIEYVNQKFTEITGYSFEEVRGRTPRVFASPETPEQTYHELWSAITKGEIWRGVMRSKRRDGSLFSERTLISPVRAQAGDTITHFIALQEDITSQQEIEAQLHQAQKMEAIGQLAAGIAHEINTPTQFVNDNVSFLKGAFDDLLELLRAYRSALAAVPAGPGREDLARELRAVEERVDIDYVSADAPSAFEASLDGLRRIATIVQAMKDFSHPDQREMESADLNAAIVNTLTIAHNEYKYVADVEKSLGELPPVPCRVGEVCQVFLNLLVNAAHAIGDVVKVSGKRGLIRVRSVAEPDFVRVEIEDDGTGIPEAAQKRIFEPFFTTKEVGKGTGQGLTLAHNIVVRKHKGTLTFETAVGKGTTFIVRLPRQPDDQAGSAKVDAASA